MPTVLVIHAAAATNFVERTWLVPLPQAGSMLGSRRAGNKIAGAVFVERMPGQVRAGCHAGGGTARPCYRLSGERAKGLEVEP
jgi:hypothetical protein